MADTIREQIIKAFVARVQPLSSIEVYRAVRHTTDPVDRFITLWDGEDTLSESDYDTDILQFPIVIDAQWDTSDLQPSVSANALIGEIRKIIESTDTGFSGLVRHLAYESATPSYPVSGSSTTALAVIYTITYETLHGDPYTLPI